MVYLIIVSHEDDDEQALVQLVPWCLSTHTDFECPFVNRSSSESRTSVSLLDSEPVISPRRSHFYRP